MSPPGAVMFGTALALAALLCRATASRRDDYDPDETLSATEIIRRHGYPSESHVILTKDDYLLTLHRIPSGRDGLRGNDTGKEVVFLQHGLLSSSCDWLLSGPGNSLAYLLAENNYDVWLGNARGNTYSKAHAALSTEDAAYWDFSWDEMAAYDLPEAIDYVLRKTGKKQLTYVGHSMGTTMFFAMASALPQYGDKVKGMFALAPVAYVAHIRSPIRMLAPWANDLKFIAKYLGAGDFLPNNKMIKLLSKYGCELVTWEEDICSNILFVLCGFDRDQFNATLLPVIFGHTPAGTSTKTVVHFAQEINSGGAFQRFDYGKSGNLRKYGRATPPRYDLSRVTAPVALFYGDNDWLASRVDVARLYDALPRKMGKFLVPYKGFNHIDFLWGRDAKTLVYDRILELMKTT